MPRELLLQAPRCLALGGLWRRTGEAVNAQGNILG